MSYFSELNSNTLTIKDLLLADDDLCLLLYDNSFNPLAATPLSNPEILMMTNIFPLPKSPDAETGKITFLNYYLYKAEPWSPNSGFKKLYFCFDIVCHLNLWMINNGLRPYSILNRLDNMFNNKYINELSDKSVFWDDAKLIRYADKFYGYHVIYDLTHTSNLNDRI